MCKEKGHSSAKDRSAQKTQRQLAIKDTVVHQIVFAFDSQ